jgi:magnesium transporter
MACSLSPLDVGHDDASKRQGGPEEDPYEEGQGHVTYSLIWGETLRPQRLTPHRARIPNICRVMHCWSTPSRLHQAEPTCPCRWSARHHLHRLADDLRAMNVPYPGFAQHAGFVASVVLVVVLSGGLYLLFKRLDWL